VHNAAPRIPDTLRAREVARIGKREGPATELFGDVAFFHPTPWAEVLVQDRQAADIRRFAADGSFLGYLSRAGEGPGETKYVLDFAASGDGRVATYDLGNRRVTVFAEDGPTESVRLPEGPARYHTDALSFHMDGSLWVAVNSMTPLGGPVQHPRPIFARIDSAGSLVDTVWTERRFTRDCPTLSNWRMLAGFWEDQREPFVPNVEWTLGRNGTLVIGCPATYRFEILSGEGARTVVTREWSSWTVPDDARAFQGGRGFRVPATRPAYASITVPGDGRIWVWPNQPLIPVEPTPQIRELTGLETTWRLSPHGSFDVFTEQGNWLATVALPDEARHSGFPTEPSVVIRGDTIWAVGEDSYEVQTVRKYVVQGFAARVDSAPGPSESGPSSSPR
jgi:hypothetical protein